MSGASRDLLERARDGVEGAFEELVAEMGPRLMGYFLRQGAVHPLAEDLTQHVFLRLVQALPRYRPSGRWEAYCLRIARNLWIDHHRRRGRGVVIGEPDDEADPGPGPDERAAAGDRAARLRDLLAAQDDGTRELLELAVLQQLPYKEVGLMLGIPVGTVKSRVYYALRRLRDQADPESLT
ncbi:MAG: RNA polymerase sigma factor [Planctomycetota bacterium]|jgi:RNA polymerase sigma-70 factor (ECF subfamily)